jgi:hypothetical protein
MMRGRCVPNTLKRNGSVVGGQVSCGVSFERVVFLGSRGGRTGARHKVHLVLFVTLRVYGVTSRIGAPVHDHHGHCWQQFGSDRWNC